MQKQIFIPNFICIRDKLASDYNFDDSKRFYQTNLKISGFRVSICNSKLCGISFLYKQNGERAGFGNYNLKKSHKITTHDFIIDDDDYIQILYGCFKKVITQFGVITYKGKQVTFGQDLGEKFKYLYMGFTFTLAFGEFNYDGGFESLGFRVQKLPKEYLITYYTPLAELLYPNDFNINYYYQNQQPAQINDNQYNNKEIQPLCDKISNQQISASQNSQNFNNNGNQQNQGKKYGIQSMMVIQKEIKLQQFQEEKQGSSFSPKISNVSGKCVLVVIGCILVFACCSIIKEKIIHKDDDQEGQRR